MVLLHAYCGRLRPVPIRKRPLASLAKQERMSNETQAPAAPAVITAPVAGVTPDSRSGDGTESSRPAGPANITGAELSAKLAANRRARRAGGVAEQPKSPGATANQAPTPRKATPATGVSGEAGPDSEHATSPSSGDAAVIDGLANGGAAQNGNSQGTDDAGTASNAATETPPAETSLEDLIDDPESATEDQIKAVKDRGIRKLLGRVHKLTARLKEAERGQAAPESDSVGQAPPGSDPRVAQLEQNLNLLRAANQWARSNPEGGEFKGPDGKVIGTYTADQVEGILANAPDQIAALTARLEVRQETLQKERLQVTQASLEAATKAYPWLANPESPEYGEALAIIQQAPYLKTHPEWPAWVADAIAGRRARLAQADAASKSKPLPRANPPKVPPPSSSAAPRVDPSAKALAEAEAAYSKSGSESDLKVVLRLRRQARTRP